MPVIMSVYVSDVCRREGGRGEKREVGREKERER